MVEFLLFNLNGADINLAKEFRPVQFCFALCTTGLLEAWSDRREWEPVQRHGHVCTMGRECWSWKWLTTSTYLFDKHSISQGNMAST